MARGTLWAKIIAASQHGAPSKEVRLLMSATPWHAAEVEAYPRGGKPQPRCRISDFSGPLGCLRKAMEMQTLTPGPVLYGHSAVVFPATWSMVVFGGRCCGLRVLGVQRRVFLLPLVRQPRSIQPYASAFLQDLHSREGTPHICSQTQGTMAPSARSSVCNQGAHHCRASPILGFEAMTYGSLASRRLGKLVS